MLAISMYHILLSVCLYGWAHHSLIVITVNTLIVITVDTTQYNTIGESYLKMPSSQHPVARWYSLKTRSRTVLDLGRRMVEGRSGSGEDSIGQLFLVALLLDPLELTQIGQGLMELPQGEQSRAHDELTTGRMMHKLGP